MEMQKVNKYGSDESRKFQATGYFRLEKANDRWWMVDPEGNGFITIGLNHPDESNLKYPHNIDIWKKKYGSREKWIKDGLVKDLNDWGFNTIGWTQDYISGDWGVALDWGVNINLWHSMGWSAADYKHADTPYILQLPVAEIQDWNGHPSFPDVYSRDFDVFCEYLTRSICADHADNKNLIGYFLVDIPAWLPHASGRDFELLKGLDEKTRDIKLYDVASKYYETIVKHIKRYDPNHLILGDRYNGNKGIPTAVLKAMKNYVDVLSVQYFPTNSPKGHQQMRNDLAQWQEITGKPVILADIGNSCATNMNPNRKSALADQAARANDYIGSMNSVINEPWFIGWHWCAHVENTARGWGIKDPWDEPYQDFANPISEYNKSIYKKI